MKTVAISLIILAASRCYGGCPPPCGVLNWTGEWLVPPHCGPCVVAPPPPPCGPCAQEHVVPAPAPRDNGYSKEGNVSRPRTRHRHHAHPNVSVSAVRSNDIVRVYDIGRYVDPVDCRVMHERHAVYRLESSSGWKLQPPVGQNEILLGPIVGLRRAEYHPEPVAGELAQQVEQTRHDAEVAYSSTEVLKSRLDELTQRLDDNVSRENTNQALIVDEIKRIKEQLGASHLSPSPSPGSTQ